MKLHRHLICLLLPALFAAGGAQAQLYKSVGPDGKVTYSDTPPPVNQKLVEKRDLNSAIDTSNLPYELAQAVAQSPVVIYTGASCAPCNDGKNMLRSAGVPFTEKTVKSNEDIEKLKQAGGDTQLPLLLVGRQKLRGFSTEEWQSALTSAGYPSSNRLPAGYRYPPAESAAPSAADNGKALIQTPAAPARKSLPVKKPETDNGFRF